MEFSDERPRPQNGEGHRNSNNPLVSVIIPTFNYADFLGAAAESVLTQTVADLELLVIDDGSQDSTPQVIANIDDPRLTAVRTENRGTSNARNLGLSLSRGDFVAFLDADDLWHSQKLEIQLRLLAEPKLDFGFSNFVRFDSKGTFPQSQFAFVPEFRQMDRHRSSTGEGWIVSHDPFLSLIETRQLAAWPSTLLIRGELARSARFPDTSQDISEDLFYILLVAARSERIAYSELPLAALRRHGANSYGSPVRKIEADIAVLQEFERQSSEELDASQKRALSERIGREWCSLGHAHFREGHAVQSGRAYIRALARPEVRLNAVRHLVALPVVPILPRLLSNEDAGSFDDPESRTVFPWTQDGEFRDEWIVSRVDSVDT